MPSFCRHGRLEENCPICSKKPRTRPGTVAGREEARRSAPRPKAEPSERAPRGVAAGGGSARKRTPRAGAMTVRRMARAVDDGYINELVPGLHSSVDAARLAEELAFAAARLEELSSAPTGLYAEAGAYEDREEGIWLAFQIAWLSPREDAEDPFAAIAAAMVPWATGEVPAFSPEAYGPRGGDARKAVEAVASYRSHVAKAGSQHALLSAEAALTPGRRFERAFERLAIPGFGRAPRYEFVLTCGRLGLVDAEPSSLQLATRDAMDPTVLAAKRVFKIGDATLLSRRASDLAAAAGVPIGALDLALRNWADPSGRIVAGSAAIADPDVLALVDDALHVDRGGAADDDLVD